MNNIFSKTEQWCARQPRWAMWLAAALWYGFITYLSHIPTSSSASTKNLVGGDDFLNAAFRFCAHLGVFGVLGIFIYLAWQHNFTFVPTSFCIVLCIVCLAGIIDEAHQYTVPGRFARVQDVVTDTLGASIAVAVLTRLKKRIRDGN